MMKNPPAQQPVDALASGLLTALVGAVLSFGLVCLALGGMFSNLDSRLLLTVTDTFGGLAEIRDVFNSTASYLAISNPLRVDHVPFPPGPETREELEDLVRRGLMPGSALAAFQTINPASDPSLLRRLMVASWCSSGRAIPNVLPAQRTPGCQCIADAYLDLVKSTLPASVNASTVVQVPVDVRSRVASRVYRCWDQRQVRRSRQCGDACKTHLLGLPLFANIVLFLVCMSYLAFVQLGRSGWNIYVIKLLVVAMGVVLCIPFFVRYVEANALNISGVVVCLFYITVSLHSELDVNVPQEKAVNPLSVCFLVNLPLILSAHAIQLGVSGYGRDLWAVLSFGACGGLLGVLLQVCFFRVRPSFHRFYWTCFFFFGASATSGCATTGSCPTRRGILHRQSLCASSTCTISRCTRGSPCPGPSSACRSYSSCSSWRIGTTAARTAGRPGSCRSPTKSSCGSWRSCTSATLMIWTSTTVTLECAASCRAGPSSRRGWPAWA